MPVDGERGILTMTIEQLEAIVKAQAERIERLERALGNIWGEEFLPSYSDYQYSPEARYGKLDKQ
jgi:hypothetical protein